MPTCARCTRQPRRIGSRASAASQFSSKETAGTCDVLPDGLHGAARRRDVRTSRDMGTGTWGTSTLDRDMQTCGPGTCGPGTCHRVASSLVHSPTRRSAPMAFFSGRIHHERVAQRTRMVDAVAPPGPGGPSHDALALRSRDAQGPMRSFVLLSSQGVEGCLSRLGGGLVTFSSPTSGGDSGPTGLPPGSWL